MSPAARAPCVLLISPGIIKWTDLDFGLPHLVSLGGYLLQHLGERAVRVEIIDLNYEGTDHRELRRTLEGFAPFVCIGISCYSSYDYLRVLALARFLERVFPGVPIVSGGYHASAMPGDLIFDGSPFDAVLRGEGERSLLAVVHDLLGGGRIEQPIVERDVIEDLDTLPPYRWDLLKRYWPRARHIGRKLQIYLSRGCPYHCTFCMERAKSGYAWRSYSPERALDELSNLARFTSLGDWVVNLADPLFGFRRSWRREVLQGIIRRELLPRQYWTLTRSDDLDAVDVELLARARFSIGIGVESGSPEMLARMQKGNRPDRYLDALRRLSRLSREHGLNWAANIIVGHPGETLATMAETHAFLVELFTTAKETCGWLSIDPFRLYPGAQVHEEMAGYARDYGTRFYHPEWWKSWYDAPFRAEHIDPSATLDFETRVRRMYDLYGPLVGEILKRFRGQGRSVDRVFQRSLDEQARSMSSETRDRIVRAAARVRTAPAPVVVPSDDAAVLAFPIGLHVRDPWVRHRESAVRRLLEGGVLRTEALVEAILLTPPDRYLADDDARRLLDDGPADPDLPEGAPPATLGLHTLALALEALGAGAGDTAADLLAVRGYVAALLSELVGPDGRVVACHPAGRLTGTRLRAGLGHLANVEVLGGSPATDLAIALPTPLDAAWIGAAWPRFPTRLGSLLRRPGGRVATLIGPRFRRQDLVCLSVAGPVHPSAGLVERRLARVRAPVVAGPGGWLRSGADRL